MGSETQSRYAAWMKQTISVQKPLVAVLAALMIGLLTADYFLLLQVRKADLAARARTMSLALKVEEVVPPLYGVALDGTTVNIPYAGDNRHTIIFVFSTSCPICAANWPNWKKLADHIDARRYRVIYANLSDSLSRSYVDDHHLADAIVLAKVDPRTSQAYSLWFTLRRC